MSYSNINDAFNTTNIFSSHPTYNINNNFKNYENFENIDKYNNYNNIENFNNSEVDNISYDEIKESEDNNLSGTHLTQLITQISNEKQLLTHRDCINIYNNPEFFTDKDISNALKHITKCNMCKNEIKSKEIHYSEDNTKINNVHNEPAKNTESTENHLHNQVENEQIKNNYNNTDLQNFISKYINDIEEKKKLNSKIDKILDLISSNTNNTNNTNNINNTLSYGFIEINYLNIGIIIIILLLIIDIILRIKSNK